ncbi:MAG: ParB/RepB/Spo0J family partition protein, partial [Planctomycetota bacterium]
MSKNQTNQGREGDTQRRSATSGNRRSRGAASRSAAGKDRRLGRGLAVLLGSSMEDEDDAELQQLAETPQPRLARDTHDGQATPSNATDATDENIAGNILSLPVDEIEVNPFQPRREFNESEIAALAESLKEHQQLQPVLVRRVDDRYQLISGERRLRATRYAGLDTIRAEIRDADDRLVAELAIIENLQRKDLNAIEKALSFRNYINQHGCRIEDLAKRLKVDRSTIANLMRLLELPESIQSMLTGGTISAGHARALLPLGEEQQQLDLASRVVEEKLSVRALEHTVSEVLRLEDALESGDNSSGTGNPAGGPKPKPPKRRTVSPQIESMQREMRLQLGTKVE